VVSSGISPEGLVAFLAWLGQQDLQPLALFPGFEIEGIRRWPRFRIGRVVVFRRRWTFAAAETPFVEPCEPLAARRALEVARWRHRHGLPRHVFAHTGDDPKPFVVDLESPWLVERLVRALAPGQSLHVTEMLPAPDALWVRDDRDRGCASEFLLHLRGPAVEGEVGP
jgi:hypothetical protein